jgi:divalent metal cation (Fe/Co/Zn/Cd) transporter
MDKLGKSVVAFLYALAVTAVPFFTGNHRPDASEGIAILIAACTAALVYLVPLAESAPWVKTAVAAVLAAAQVAATVIVGGVDGNDVLLIVAAFLGALGIYLAPAASRDAVVGWGSDKAL